MLKNIWKPTASMTIMAMLVVLVELFGLFIQLSIALEGNSTPTGNPAQSVPAMPAMPKAPNFFTLSSVQRRSHTVRYQVPPRNKNSTELPRLDKIMIPIGVSHYKPIQFIDKPFKPVEFPNFLLNKSPKARSLEPTLNNANATNNVLTVKNNEKRQANQTLTAAAATVNSSVTNITMASLNDTTEGFRTEQGFFHKPRMIELESSYIPLTLRFSSKARKLNIISHDNDLIGQDSNRHDRFNGNVNNNNNNNFINNNNKPGEPIDIVDPNKGTFNLDTRTIFGPNRREEPIILKPGQTNAQIPENLQSIIKCVFPDFVFDGSDKIRSAC